ncbi:MAG TPA: thioredoxin [Blastocatellia bacterium]|nr:thioredoxin [Blastocatellia bacterium]
MSAKPDSQLIKCLSCGATNRVAPDKLAAGREPVCARCKTPLSGPAHPITITDSNYAEVVERSPFPVLIDFWAAWCGPCRMVAPVVEELARELAGKVRIGKLNIDENQATAYRFGVNSIPTLVIMKNGREVDRIVGAQPKAAIMSKLKAFV